jgi:hypothetical protein
MANCWKIAASRGGSERGKKRGRAHSRLILLSLYKRPAAAKAPHDKAVLQGQIDATDRQIDGLVYDLYGLAEEEIRIVEGTAT